MGNISAKRTIGLFIQLFGTLSTYLTILLVARFDGPAGQGHFVALKSFVDTTSGLFLAGLPQAVILALNRKQTNVISLTRHTAIYSAATFIASLPITFAILAAADLNKISTSLLISFAISGLVLFAITRAILLTKNDGIFFSFFTCLPQILLMATAVLAASSSIPNYEPPFFFMACILFIGSYCVLYTINKEESDRTTQSLPLKFLMIENLYGFIQSLLYNAQLLVFLYLISFTTKSSVLSGLFSTSVLPLLAVHACVGIVAPILYNDWSKRRTHAPLGHLLKRVGMLALFLQLVALCSLPAVGPVILIIFGSEHVQATVPTQLGILAVFPVLVSRILSPYLQTTNRGKLNTASCMLRAVVSVIGLSVAVHRGNENLLYWSMIAWVAGEWVALALLAANERLNLARCGAE